MFLDNEYELSEIRYQNTEKEQQLDSVCENTDGDSNSVMIENQMKIMKAIARLETKVECLAKAVLGKTPELVEKSTIT